MSIVMKINRTLDLNKLLKKKSHFLFGPRSTGKSTLIKDQINEKYLVINLLRNEYFMALSQSPQSLEDMINTVNNQEIVTLMTVGDHPEYLAIGYLLNQNMIKKTDRIKRIEHNLELKVVVVRTSRKTIKYQNGDL